MNRVWNAIKKLFTAFSVAYVGAGGLILLLLTVLSYIVIGVAAITILFKIVNIFF